VAERAHQRLDVGQLLGREADSRACASCARATHGSAITAGPQLFGRAPQELARGLGHGFGEVSGQWRRRRAAPPAARRRTAPARAPRPGSRFGQTLELGEHGVTALAARLLQQRQRPRPPPFQARVDRRLVTPSQIVASDAIDFLPCCSKRAAQRRSSSGSGSSSERARFTCSTASLSPAETSHSTKCA
jgi:hypothetical protein